MEWKFQVTHFKYTRYFLRLTRLRFKVYEISCISDGLLFFSRICMKWRWCSRGFPSAPRRCRPALRRRGRASGCPGSGGASSKELEGCAVRACGFSEIFVLTIFAVINITIYYFGLYFYKKNILLRRHSRLDIYWQYIN